MISILSSVVDWVLFLLATVSAFIGGKCLYNLFLHPLRNYPGPLLARSTAAIRHFHIVRGTETLWAHELHKRYGPIVRLEPNNLSFIDGKAARDVLGSKAGQKTNRKPPRYPSSYDTGELPMVMLPDDINHGKRRKIFSHAFSDQALRKQESIFHKYVDLLVTTLRRQTTEEPEREYDIVSYLNWTTFDIMADLTFAEPLGLLDQAADTPWVRQSLMFLKAWGTLLVARSYPPLGFLLNALVPSSIKKQAQEHRRFAEERVDRRIEKKLNRPDIWGLVLKQEGEDIINRREMYEESMIFMIGGTETTATALSGTLYYLTRSPHVLNKLRKELQIAFPKEISITGDKLRALPYLCAVIEEGLRIYPPVPFASPRVTPAEGAVVLGEHVPGNTLVQFTHYAAYHSEYNFALPDEFHPERWISGCDTRFANDNKGALHVFSYGPRNCIGKNMAYFELRLILAKLVLHFDFELCAQSEAWLQGQQTFVVWDKPPLICKIRPLAAESMLPCFAAA